MCIYIYILHLLRFHPEFYNINFKSSTILIYSVLRTCFVVNKQHFNTVNKSVEQIRHCYSR